MAVPHEHSGAHDESAVAPTRESSTPTPRWVKVSVVVAAAVLLLLVVLLVFNGGSHGPGRH